MAEPVRQQSCRNPAQKARDDAAAGIVPYLQSGDAIPAEHVMDPVPRKNGYEGS